MKTRGHRHATLASRTALLAPCNVADLNEWLAAEIAGHPAGPIRDVLTIVGGSVPTFTCWADHARLLIPKRGTARHREALTPLMQP